MVVVCSAKAKISMSQK